MPSKLAKYTGNTSPFVKYSGSIGAFIKNRTAPLLMAPGLSALARIAVPKEPTTGAASVS